MVFVHYTREEADPGHLFRQPCYTLQRFMLEFGHCRALNCTTSRNRHPKDRCIRFTDARQASCGPDTASEWHPRSNIDADARTRAASADELRHIRPLSFVENRCRARRSFAALAGESTPQRATDPGSH